MALVAVILLLVVRRVLLRLLRVVVLRLVLGLRVRVRLLVGRLIGLLRAAASQVLRVAPVAPAEVAAVARERHLARLHRHLAQAGLPAIRERLDALLAAAVLLMEGLRLLLDLDALRAAQ